jgi:hypothetical protein
MAGSLDDRVTLVLTPGDYEFVVIGSQTPGESKLYRNPFIDPTGIAAALRRIADSLDRTGR